MRLVVCALGCEGGLLELPASLVSGQRQFPTGGERSLYELAVAAAVLGVDVELRGDLNRKVLGELTSAAGVAPRVGVDARPAEAADVVVVPEGDPSPAHVAAVYLSPARGVVYFLAPPGLFGPSWRPGWQPAEPATVDVDSVGQPANFRNWADLGFSLWTNAHGIADAAAESGRDVTWLGTGTPVPFGLPVEKSYDVAIIEGNRWRPLAEEILGRLDGVSVLRVPPTPSVYSLGPSVAPARVLLWPSRLEGMSRIAREARGVGTVPVVLDTNPFVTPEDWGRGCVRVPRLEDLGPAVADLLADDDRLRTLAEEGRQGAKEQTGWPAFVRRVGEALRRLEDGSPADVGPRAELGASLGTHGRARDRKATDTIAELEAYIAGLRQDITNAKDAVAYLQRRLEEAQISISSLETLMDATRAERDEAVRRGSAVVPQAAQIAALTDALAAAQAELAAFRGRRIVRFVGQSPPARLFSRPRPGAR